MATMAQNLGTEHMGKIAGLTSTITAAGTTAGPVLAGLLFEAGGYWCAWAGPAAFLLVDIIMRLLMMEKPIKLRRVVENQEEEPLLQDGPPTVTGEQPDHSTSSGVNGWRFHICLLREKRFSAGVFCAYVFAVLIGCLESTLAVHVRIAFGWRALHVGLLFALIQGPGMLLAGPVGWMKDRIGSRTPTAVGFFGLVPFVIALGVPGDNIFPWAKDEAFGKSLYVVCMAAIGCLLSLLNGAGSIEAAGE
jgi:MFS family permease